MSCEETVVAVINAAQTWASHPCPSPWLHGQLLKRDCLVEQCWRMGGQGRVGCWRCLEQQGEQRSLGYILTEKTPVHLLLLMHVAVCRCCCCCHVGGGHDDCGPCSCCCCCRCRCPYPHPCWRGLVRKVEMNQHPCPLVRVESRRRRAAVEMRAGGRMMMMMMMMSGRQVNEERK
jgi:hypothetical protein